MVIMKTRKTPSKSPHTALKKMNDTASYTRTNDKTITNVKRKKSCPILSKDKIVTEPRTGINDVINDLREKVKIEDVESAVKGVIKFHSENPKLKTELFQDLCPLFLQISFMKLPVGHSKILRIPVPHSILTPDHEACLIVPEVKGIKNTEHEKHVEYYEELLRNKGVTNIKKIMTCHELRTEYETFEQKSRLVDLYDIFLVDGKVSGKVVKKCGKIFYKKRKVPVPVKLQVTKLKEHIEKSLSKVFFFLHLRGDSYTVQFGHDQMETNKLVENIYIILEFLEKQFQGFENVKGVQVHAPRSTSIPIYLNFSKYVLNIDTHTSEQIQESPNEIPAPFMKIRKPKAYKTYKDELTTLHNTEVTVKPTGEVLVNRVVNKERTERDDDITDFDIIQDDTREINEGDKKQSKSRKRKLKLKQQAVNEAIKKKRKFVEERHSTAAKSVIENKLNTDKKHGKDKAPKNKQDKNQNITKNATKQKDKLNKVKSKMNEFKQNKGGNKKKSLRSINEPYGNTIMLK